MLVDRLIKRLVCGSVLLLTCGLADAQSAVTLYGAVDGGFFFENRSAGSTPGQNAGKTFAVVDGGWDPSRWGLKGTEDLGGHLTVNFQLESGFTLTNGEIGNGNGNFFGRQAWVDLAGDYGTLKTGVQFSPFFYALYETDARSFEFFGSGIVNYVDNVLATGAFDANGISYTSPKIGGLVASAEIELGGSPGDFQAGRKYSAALKYQIGPLLINAAIYDGNSGGTGQTPLPSTVEFEGRTIGAAYKIGTVTARAAFVNYKVAGSFNNNVYSGGLEWLALPSLDIDLGAYVTSDRNHTANHSVLAAIGAEYFLSKTTGVYAQLGIVNNHGAMNTGLAIAAFTGASGTTIGGNIGVRHNF
jgi:predicted porin